MLYAIFAVIGLIFFFGILAWFVERNPRFSFFIYRFSGTLSILCGGGFLQGLLNAESKRPGTALLFLALMFYFIWLVKIIGVILNSESEKWWMLLLKIYFGIFSFVFFPVGMLAFAGHDAFVVRRIHHR